MNIKHTEYFTTLLADHLLLSKRKIQVTYKAKLNPVHLLDHPSSIETDHSGTIPYRIPSTIVAYRYPCEMLISFIVRAGSN